MSLENHAAEPRLRDCPPGYRFICGNGSVWVRGDEHGSHHDVFKATRESDGLESCFAGNVKFRGAP
jgi:hypothetical protein